MDVALRLEVCSGMQFMAVMRRRMEAFPQEEFDKYLEAEAEAVRTMYIAGTIRAIWSRGDALGAVLLLEADSPDSAEQLIASLPLMQRDMLEREKLIPLRGYRGFGPRG
jgi:muconolactone delta-isomerase